MRRCRCGGAPFDERYRFCPWCGAAQRLKIVEYFPAMQLSEADSTRGLRVSRYLLPPGHVRLSIWDVGTVKGAVSLDEPEARRLARFLRLTDPLQPRPRLAERLKHEASALRQSLH